MKIICKKSSIALIGLLSLAFILVSCDDNTDTFGFEVMPEDDEAVVSQAVYDVYSKSIKVDSLIANSSDCYLGKVTDPETNSTTICNFLAQFYSLEDYQLPAYDQMYKENGEVIADSVELRLYIQSYYGDSLNSIKIGVYELDSAHVMEENQSYYTNIDAESYVNHAPDAMSQEATFAVADLSLSDSVRYSSSYVKNICIKLPKTFGSKILNKYYTHPEYFKNSYTFIHHVVPGFYFKVLSGNGTMVNIDVTTLSVFFRYQNNDTTYVGIQRVAATEEVIQNNYIENCNIDRLLNETGHTFLKTPAGIFTEVTLPIDDIYQQHQNDSVNSAKIVFKRQNNNQLSRFNLPTPSTLLMVRKGELNSFFEQHQTPNGTTSFSTNFDTSYNSYTFSNIANLVSFLYRLRNIGAGIKNSDSDAQKKQKLSAWEAENPDWNKVVLVPVTTETNALNAISSMHNDFSLSSTRLIGGDENPISISIIYSHFKD